MGSAVQSAVERFVTVGETIADENPDIQPEMYDACHEARTAGEGEFVFLYRFNTWRFIFPPSFAEENFFYYILFENLSERLGKVRGISSCLCLPLDGQCAVS